jgi:ABC-2 type transport system ATP-binding protein
MSTHQMYQVEALCTRIALINQGRSVLYGQVSDIKRQFAGNAVNLTGDGRLPDLPGILETRRENGGYHLILDNETTPQDIFRLLAAHSDWRVDRFEAAAPSLDDIFVAVVQGETPVNLRGLEDLGGLESGGDGDA